MENENRGDKKPPHKKHLNFNNCTKNTIKSLNEVEYFLNNLKNIQLHLEILLYFLYNY